MGVWQQVEQCSLLIFDECHNAVGNSPMVGIMRDAVLRVPAAQRPRIVGLTGSILNGSLENAAVKRQRLEEVLTAPVFCPDMREFVQNQNKDFFTVTYEAPPSGMRAMVEEKMRLVLAGFEGLFRLEADRKKVERTALHVCESTCVFSANACT